MSGGGFKVKIDTDWGEPPIELRVTHNGLYWATLTLRSREQVKKTIAALQAWLDAHPEIPAVLGREEEKP